MHVEAWGPPGMLLLLLYRQKGLELSCGLRTKQANNKMVQTGELK